MFVHGITPSPPPRSTLSSRDDALDLQRVHDKARLLDRAKCLHRSDIVARIDGSKILMLINPRPIYLRDERNLNAKLLHSLGLSVRNVVGTLLIIGNVVIDQKWELPKGLDWGGKTPVLRLPKSPGVH